LSAGAAAGCGATDFNDGKVESDVRGAVDALEKVFCSSKVFYRIVVTGLQSIGRAVRSGMHVKEMGEIT
jgi:hypothetical protein